MDQKTNDNKGKHILLSKNVFPLKTWEEWLDRWNKADSYDELMGLLHCGFNVASRYDSDITNECVLFYMQVADGWSGRSSIPHDVGEYIIGRDEEANNHAVRVSKHKLYELIMKKAFDMLCQNFFKEVNKYVQKWYEHSNQREDLINWLYNTIISTPLFEGIQNFFSFEEYIHGGEVIMRNVRRSQKSNNEEIMIAFITNLAYFFWEWKDEDIEDYWDDDRKNEMREYNLGMREKIQQAEPWMIKLLVAVNRLDLLEKYLLNFDEITISTLTEMALQQKLTHYNHNVKEDRCALTIEEAFYAGSQAALLVIKHRIVKGEDIRLEGILEAQREIDRANKKIKGLTT